jgi:hypothetical protein
MSQYHEHAYTLTDTPILDAALPSAGIIEADADWIVAESVEYAGVAGGPNSLAASKAAMVVTATLTHAGGLPAGARIRWDFGPGRIENSTNLVQAYTYAVAGTYQIRATVSEIGKASRDYYTQIAVP